MSSTQVAKLSFGYCLLVSCATDPLTKIGLHQTPPILRSSTIKINSDLSTWTLKERIGQLLIIGYRDPEQISEIMPGGVALFSWSMKSVEQTRELTQKIRELGKRQLKAPLFIATDHEGGRVMRLRNGMTLFPEASAIGTSNDLDLARRVGKAVGEELAYLGIDANFAPVLDLGGAESFLGNRLWANNAGDVAALTGAYIQGLQDTGVVSVAKHFPGHGTSANDSHFSVPVNDKKLRTLWGEDFKPFKQAVIEKVPAMMTAHVRVPEVDRLPASMSSRFLSRILRDTFKFEGVIITDDLEMKGAQESMLTAGDLGLQALIAGSDMLLIVWSKKDQKSILSRVEKAILSGEWSEAELDRKLARVLKLKSEWLENTQWNEYHDKRVSPLKSKKHLALVDEINAKPLRWMGISSKEIGQKFAKSHRSAWRVALPKGDYAEYWKTIRPQDEVFIHERRLSASKFEELKRKFSSTECAQKLCMILTESATQSYAAFYQHVITLIGSPLSEAKAPASDSSAEVNSGSILWAHMGLEPNVAGMANNTGLVILGGSGLPRFKQLSLELAPK